MGREGHATGRLVRAAFVRFLIAGGLNTALTYALYLLLLRFWDYLPAYSAAYVVGILLSYFLNASFVFRIRPTTSKLLKFPLVYLAQYATGAAILWICVEWFGVPRELGLVFSIAASVPITFLAARVVLQGDAR